MAPDAVAEILLRPQIGSWAAYTLRRIRKGLRTPVPTPLWVDLGTLHAVALIATATSGLTWRTRLPARSGNVMIPGLGMVTLPGGPRHTYVEVETEAGEIRLRGADPAAAQFELTIGPQPEGETQTANWWALRNLRVGEDPELRVWLDDLDPFRDLADPVAPDRLSEPDASRWYKLLDEAWTVLSSDDRQTAEAMAVGVVTLVPLPVDGDWSLRSASTGEAFGSVMVSPPPDAVSLAVSLVHEFQHIKLGGLMHLGPLYRQDDAQLYYAPWRDDPRPLSGLIQGIYAFVGIAAFWRARRSSTQGIDYTDRRIADFEYAYARGQAAEALRGIVGSEGLTPWGRKVAHSLAARIEPWLSEKVPDELAQAAKLLADSHRAGWRIRHARAAPADVYALADAFQSGRVLELAPYSVDVKPGTPQRWSSAMAALVRQQVARSQLPSVDDAQADLTADSALVSGDNALARSEYLARLSADHTDLEAWVGLGLADKACGALIKRPEVVLAVFSHLLEKDVRSDPAALAAWMSRLMKL